MTVMPEMPNPPEGTRVPDLTRPSRGAYGEPPASGTAAHGEIVKVSRVLRVQLDGISDSAWNDLRALARECSQFCNAKLADAYAQALGYAMPVSTERRAGGRLSGDVYVALGREAFTVWRRHSGKILSGAQRLALFDADRAIVCRGEYRSKGRRIRCALLARDGDRYRLVMRLVKASAGPRAEFDVWWKPQADHWISPLLASIAAGETRLLKVSIVFERPGRKVFALLTYEKAITVPPMGARAGALGPLEPDGTLWLRVQGPDGRRQEHNYSGDIARLVHMKTHFLGVRDRLKRTIRRSGHGARALHRRALLKAGSFSAWSQGVLHQISHDIVARCARAGVGELSILPMLHADLPMAALQSQIAYKAAEAGIQIVRPDVSDEPTGRAVARPVAKQGRRVQAAAKALAALKKELV